MAELLCPIRVLVVSPRVGCLGAGDCGGSGGGGGQVTITFGAGTNPGGIASATPRFAFASNDDNTIS